MTDGRDLRRGGGRRRPGRRHGGRRSRAARPLGAAARPGRPDQALRRRHPAAADPRLRHPGRAARRAGQRRPHGLARATRRSTCRSRAASSAWSTARCSTSGCATAPPPRGRSGATGTFERLDRDADGTALSTTAQATADAERTRARAGRDRRRRRAVGRWPARTVPGADAHALRLRLSRDRPLAAGRRASRTSTPRAATSTTTARSRPTSTPGSSRTATPPASAPGSRQQGLLAARLGRGLARGDRPRRRETIRREGAPIPLKPLKRWDNGRDVVLAGDAAGVVAPASGEGIYYAMVGGRLAAEAVDQFLATGDARALASARAHLEAAADLPDAVEHEAGGAGRRPTGRTRRRDPARWRTARTRGR